MGRAVLTAGATAVAAAMLAAWLRRAPAERAVRGGSHDGTLLDEVCPDYEFAGVESVEIAAPPAAVFEAIQRVTLAEMPVARALGTLRYLPGILLGRVRPRADGRPFVEGLGVVLAEAPEREVVIGMAGRLHDLVDQRPVPFTSADEYARFADPGYQKFVQSFRVEPLGDDRVRLVAAHRTHALSEESRRKFRPYWRLLVGPGSGVMLRGLLDAIKRRAEAEASRTRSLAEV
jgi:hypothetical protein